MSEDSVSRWADVGAEEIPTSAFDAKVAEWQQAEAEVKRIADIKKDAQAVVDRLESELIDMLHRAKKKSYKVDGFGTATISAKWSVRTPKTNAEKQQLWDWIQEKYGDAALTGMLSINSQTLNGFVQEERDLDPLVEIPGLEAPAMKETIGFRKERK